jgi:hypothetical protein
VKRFRWVWFGIGTFSILTMPWAILDAIRTTRSDHRMVPMAVLAFTVRFLVTGLFLWLWWRDRLTKDGEGPS